MVLKAAKSFQSQTWGADRAVTQLPGSTSPAGAPHVAPKIQGDTRGKDLIREMVQGERGARADILGKTLDPCKSSARGNPVLLRFLHTDVFRWGQAQLSGNGATLESKR